MGHFDHLNVAFFTKASIYPGSIGTFRYRFQREGWTDGKGTLTVWVYENTSFELAKDVESQTLSLIHISEPTRPMWNPRPSRGRRRAWSR